jgi:UDP-3-O-[3-hydroxymyristoyl] N-acetylglucosamine deacetylase/3-hydroxyacyl-[acyl-carrier-protein] dehydratase
MKQQTIQHPVTLKGVGLHTGNTVTLTFHPAPADHGIKFQRIDLKDHPVLSADVSRVVNTQRGTTIKLGEAQVSTIEHVLSALAGLRIDNVLISLDGPEVPILDGSAMPFVSALRKAGIEQLEVDRDFFEIETPITYRDEATGTELVAMPADDFEVITMIDFNSDVLGQQFASLRNLDDYEKEIAACRTFVFLHEVEYLVQPKPHQRRRFGQRHRHCGQADEPRRIGRAGRETEQTQCARERRRRAEYAGFAIQKRTCPA